MSTNQALGWEDSFANPRPHSRDEYFGHSCIQTSQSELVKVVQKYLAFLTQPIKSNLPARGQDILLLVPCQASNS